MMPYLIFSYEVEELTIMYCLFDNKPLNIPKSLINDSGKIKQEYHGTRLSSGIYISPVIGSPYCCRSCLTSFCED